MIKTIKILIKKAKLKEDLINKIDNIIKILISKIKIILDTQLIRID